MENKDIRLIPELLIGLALIVLVFVIYWSMSPKYLSLRGGDATGGFTSYVTTAKAYSGLSSFSIDRGEIVVYKPRRIRCLEVECAKLS